MNYLPGNYIDLGAPEAPQQIKEVAVERSLGAAPVASTTLIEGEEWLSIEPGAEGEELKQERFDPDAYPELTHLVHEDIRNKIYHGTERTRRGALQELARRSFREIGLVEEYAKYVDFDRHSHIVELVSGHLDKKLSHASQDLNSYEARDEELMEAIARTYVDNDDKKGAHEFLRNMMSEGEEVAMRGESTKKRAETMLSIYTGDTSIVDAKEEENKAVDVFRTPADYGRFATSGQVEIG